MTVVPEVRAETTDVATFAAGNVTAVLRRHESGNGIVSHDIRLDTSQITTDGCTSPSDLMHLATVARHAAEALFATIRLA
jgi:hypothetical protein